MSFAESAQESTQEVVGCSQMTRGFVRDYRFSNMRSVDFNTVFSQIVYLCAEVTQNAEQDRNVTDVWHIFNDTAIFGKDGGRDNSNDRILCAADLHFAIQAIAAFNDVFFQYGSPLTLFIWVAGTIESFGNIDDSMSQPFSING